MPFKSELKNRYISAKLKEAAAHSALMEKLSLTNLLSDERKIPEKLNQFDFQLFCISVATTFLNEIISILDRNKGRIH